MLRLLGRATSGNVQKVIFLLEEMGLPYRREDYGRQFNNTGGDYLKLNPTGKVPTLIDGETVAIRPGPNKFPVTSAGARVTLNLRHPLESWVGAPGATLLDLGSTPTST